MTIYCPRCESNKNGIQKLSGIICADCRFLIQDTNPHVKIPVSEFDCFADSGDEGPIVSPYPPGAIVCGRCYEMVDAVFEPSCKEKPENLLGQPIGQYHCPDCGAMVLAGLPHPKMCKRCNEGTHPEYDDVAPIRQPDADGKKYSDVAKWPAWKRGDGV